MMPRQEYHFPSLLAAALISVALHAVPLAAEENASAVRLELLARQRWRVGMTVEAPGAISGIVATMPVPMKWPEQFVYIVDTQTTSNVGRIRYRTVDGGVTQMIVTIPRMRAGDKAEALVTFEIAKASISGPRDTTGLTAPGDRRELRQFLAVSPGIETTNPKIEKLASEIVAGKSSDWDKAEAIYDWVQANIQYKFDPELKGALAALNAGVGDCEELTSLFVAFCRVNGIPARSVWVPGHCYAEFYLRDAAGTGHWYPCQPAGKRQFGEMTEPRPILQKGDSFKLPGERKPKRYLAETFAAKNADADPRIRFVREQVETEDESP